MSINSISQIDLIVSNKVDKDIKSFVNSLENDVRLFLENNIGNGNFIYINQGTLVQDSMLQPVDLVYSRLNVLNRVLTACISKTAKEVMVRREAESIVRNYGK